MQILKRTQGIDLKSRGSAFRGDVVFQLRDAVTGRITEEQRGHNMLTNGLDSALNGCPFQLNKIDSGYGSIVGNQLNVTPLYSQLLGGVFCFPSALGNDPDLLFPGFDNSPTAFASMSDYVQSDSRQGVYDAVSSGVISNGFKSVFSWGSSFGNGTIASLGLSTRNCHKWLTDRDISFKPNDKTNSLSGFLRQLPSTRMRILSVSPKGLLLVNATGAYTGWNNLYFFKFLRPFNVSIFEDVNKYLNTVYMNIDCDNIFDNAHRYGYTWKLENAIGDGTAIDYTAQIVGDYVYLVYHSGATFTVKKLNLADGSLVSTNDYTFSASFGTGRGVLYGNYIYCAASVNDTIIKANITDIADVDDITATGVLANSEMFFVGTQFLYNDNGILDAENDLFEAFDGAFTMWSNYLKYPVGDFGMWLVLNSAYSEEYIGAAMKQWGLMTHYDLQNAVTKDASKQMVVQYSITQV